MTFTIYEVATGTLKRTFSGPPGSEFAQLAEGEALYEGELPLHCFRIENGQPVEFVPPLPSPDVEWDQDDRRFRLSAAAVARINAQRQIDDMERSQLRAMRELALGRGNQADARKRLEDIDDQIATLRAQLTP